MSRRARQNRLMPEAALAPSRIPRRLRVEGQLLQAVASGLTGLNDPRLNNVGVTRVQLTDDLQFARIFVRLSFGDDSEQRRRALMAGLKSATSRLRRAVGGTVQLRYTPTLRFIYDEGPDAAQRVDEILTELKEGE